MSMELEPRFTTFRYTLRPDVIIIPKMEVFGNTGGDAIAKAQLYVTELAADLRLLDEFLKAQKEGDL